VAALNDNTVIVVAFLTQCHCIVVAFLVHVGMVLSLSFCFSLSAL